MIQTRHSDEPVKTDIVEIRSNQSMSLDRLAAVFLGLSAVTLLVALGPAVMGYWPIMLAALVHLLIVGWCLRLAWRGNWARERVRVGPDTMVIEHFDARRQTRTRWPSAWVRVRIEQRRLGDRQVVVTCQGRRQIVGSFLPQCEQMALAEALRNSLRPITAWSSTSH